jgi:biopolymer transport protein ExbB/TolQ
VVATAAISAVLILRLSLGLAILYGLVVIVWYELLRSAVLNQVARRRSNKARAATVHRERSEQAELAERKREREAAEQEAAEESEPDPARRRYCLARKAAKAERDVAVEAASEAAKQAIERIERRCREIDRAIDHEETERVKEMLRRPSSDKTP